MLLIITENKNSSKTAALTSLPIFSLVCSPKKLPDMPLHLFSAAIITSPAHAEELCSYIKSAAPSVKIGVLLSDKCTPSARFRHFPSADAELSPPHTAGTLKKLAEMLSPPRYGQDPLFIFTKPPEAHLLGYRLPLTPNEARLLVILSKGIPMTARLLSNIGAFKESSVPVAVCRINKKAGNITSRPLIKCHRKKGYFLDPDL